MRILPSKKFNSSSHILALCLRHFYGSLALKPSNNCSSATPSTERSSVESTKKSIILMWWRAVRGAAETRRYMDCIHVPLCVKSTSGNFPPVFYSDHDWRAGAAAVSLHVTSSASRCCCCVLRREKKTRKCVNFAKHEKKRLRAIIKKYTSITKGWASLA